MVKLTLVSPLYHDCDLQTMNVSSLWLGFKGTEWFHTHEGVQKHIRNRKITAYIVPILYNFYILQTIGLKVFFFTHCQLLNLWALVSLPSHILIMETFYMQCVCTYVPWVCLLGNKFSGMCLSRDLETGAGKALAYPCEAPSSKETWLSTVL